MVMARTRFPVGAYAERNELFLAGTEPNQVEVPPRQGAARLIARIAYPPEGTTIVIDPDIPEENQLLFFEADNGTGEGLRWRLNDEVRPAGDEGRRWAPRPGRYRLALMDNDGSVLDAVSFQVR